MNHDVLLRFTKDQKVPIIIFDEPYFSYFLELYDRDFKTKEAYEMLLETLSHFDSDNEFLNEYYRVRDAIIQEMKSVPEYEQFMSADMTKYKIGQINLPNASKGNVYKGTNVGNYYISIDLQKANFQMVKKFNKAIVLNCDSYDELISKFTDMEYFKRSKYTRQVIFGNMSPKRQTTLQQYYTKQILDFIFDEYSINREDIAVFTFDEVVIKVDRYKKEEELIKIKKDIKEKLDLDVSVTNFKLAQVGDRDFFVKENSDNTISFKNVPSTYFAQVYKKYRNLPLEDNDLLFFFENRKAKFIDPLF